MVKTITIGWIVWFPLLFLVFGLCIDFKDKVAKPSSFKISGVKSEFCSHQTMYSFVCMTVTVVDSVKLGLTFYYANKTGQKCKQLHSRNPSPYNRNIPI